MLAPDQIPVVAIMGPTATGKTDAAAALFDAFDCELVSVDSSLVYRGMDIGSAKPDREFLSRYPHHLIDIRDPQETYSVAEFYQDAQDCIKRITEQGKLPVLVGGTMFYFNALEKGVNELPAADSDLRQKISQQAKILGWEGLHQQLSVLDPRRAADIRPSDAQRIQRALEIVLLSGQSVAELSENRQSGVTNPLIKIALSFSDRKQLHERIALRFEKMLEMGLQKEVERLLSCGLSLQTPAMKMIGYRQMVDFLNADLTYDEMVNKGVVATRQLAKRQLTWLRNQSNVLWWVDTGLHEKNFSQLVIYLKHKLSFLAYN